MKHPGCKIIFRTDPGDDSAEASKNNRDYCEKCFAEASKARTETRNQAQSIVPAQATDDLLSRLKEPARPMQAADLDDAEVQMPKSQRDQVLDLHKDIEALC